MRKTLHSLCLVFLFAATATAQDKTQENSDTGKYKRIIALSNRLKEYEKSHWGVEPGRFATQLPKGQAKSYLWILTQSRVKLVHNLHYAYTSLISYAEPAKASSSAIKANDKDTFSRPVFWSALDEISADLAGNDFAWQVLFILHEDFHNYDSHGLPVDLRTIEESFATAFMHFAGPAIADELFTDDVIHEMRDVADWRAGFYLRVNDCYAKLDTLYRSRLSQQEKLAARKPVLEECKQEIGKFDTEITDVNNAYLVDRSTYSFYYFFARDDLEKYGIERFLRAYLKTAAENKRSGGWLKYPFYPFKKLDSGVEKFFGADAETKRQKRETNWLKKFEINLRMAQ